MKLDIETAATRQDLVLSLPMLNPHLHGCVGQPTTFLGCSKPGSARDRSGTFTGLLLFTYSSETSMIYQFTLPMSLPHYLAR